MRFVHALAHQASKINSRTNFVTTPIFYVNAKPHLGHCYSMVLADVYARWSRLNSRPTFLTTGTDEHGLKVQNAAAKAEQDPKTFCDGLARLFQSLADQSEIKFDRFIRTTDPDHVSAVRHFWTTVWDKGLIYKGEHKGWYSVSDETFYKESDIEEQVDPKTGAKRMVSKETGSEVALETEENYFFKLSQFQDQLIDYFKAHPDFVQPAKYYDIVLRELTSGPLPDLSVSRPSSRLQWGIAVPDDTSQRIYVWFDALLNYLTASGYPHNMTTLPAWTHVIGKDITRFHCIHWPIFLMAAGLRLPKRIVVHGHWLKDGYKMSKSRGNVANPRIIMSQYDPDALRLYLMKNSVLEADHGYSERELCNLRKEFIDKFSNLVSRSISDKFHISRALARINSISVNGMLKRLPAQMAADLKAHFGRVNAIPKQMDPLVSSFRMREALEPAWEAVRAVNGFYETYKPWSLRAPKEQNQKDMLTFAALDTIRCTCILLQPFIPKYASILLDEIQVHPEKRTIRLAQIGADRSYAKTALFKKGSRVPIPRVDYYEGLEDN